MRLKHLALLDLAVPYLEKNTLGVAHTERVLSIVEHYMPFYNLGSSLEVIDWEDIVRAAAILHDIGGKSIKGTI